MRMRLNALAIETKGRIKLSSNDFVELTDEINRLYQLKVFPEGSTLTRYENFVGYPYVAEITWNDAV